MNDTWEKCLLWERSSPQPSEICALNYIPPTRLPEHRSHYERCYQHDHPEKAGVLKMRHRVGVFCAQRFAELAGKNRPDHCSNPKRQEIDRSRCTPLDLVRIDFFDDGVGNHGRTGGDAEEEER